MIKPHLVACPACARHVRVSETACPFCASVLADSLRQSAPPAAPGARLTRAALFAFGTGTLAIAPGCSSDSVGTTLLTDAETTVTPPYGLAPIPDAASDDGPTTEEDSGFDAPNFGDDAAYGAPGMDYDAEPESDGGPEAGSDGAPDGGREGGPDGGSDAGPD